MDPFASTFVLCGVRSAGRLAWERDSAAGFCRWRARTGQFTCATARPRGCGICRELPVVCKDGELPVVCKDGELNGRRMPKCYCECPVSVLQRKKVSEPTACPAVAGPRARSPRYPAGATCAGGGFLRRVVRRGDCTTCQGVVRRGDCTTCQGERSSSSGARVAKCVYALLRAPAAAPLA